MCYARCSFFLAIGAYGWYARKPDWRRYLPVVALFAAGTMAKPMVIRLPFVLLLLDYWPLGRTAGSSASAVGAPQLTGSRLLLEKIPLFVPDMADRYAYIPLIGIFVMIAWGLGDWEAKEVRTAWLIIPAVYGLTTPGSDTHRQMSYWEGQYRFLAHTLALTDPECSTYMRDGQGSALLNPGS
jgi:hypothetical protein